MNVLTSIKKEYLREYLHYLFAFEDNAFSVFRSTDFGKYLCSLIKYSDLPVRHDLPSDTQVALRMPRTSVYKGMQYKFMYFTIEDQRRIEDHLEAIFYLDFDRYYIEAMKLGQQQKIAIQNFIVSRRLTSKIGDVEMIKKRQYRADQRIINRLHRNLRKRAHLQSQIVAKTITEFEKTLNLK